MAYARALRTSSRGITPSFSWVKSSCGAEKRWKTSFISASSEPLTECSLASLDWRGFLVVFAALLLVLAGGARLLGGCFLELVGLTDDARIGVLTMACVEEGDAGGLLDGDGVDGWSRDREIRGLSVSETPLSYPARDSHRLR